MPTGEKAHDRLILAIGPRLCNSTLDCAESRRVISLEAPEVRLAKVPVQKTVDMASTATPADEMLFDVDDVAHALSLSSRRTGPTLWDTTGSTLAM